MGLEMLRSVNEESAEETRKEHIVQSAISTLSFSELEAIIHIFDEWAERKVFWLPARLLTVWELPVLLSSMLFGSLKARA